VSDRVGLVEEGNSRKNEHQSKEVGRQCYDYVDCVPSWSRQCNDRGQLEIRLYSRDSTKKVREKGGDSYRQEYLYCEGGNPGPNEETRTQLVEEIIGSLDCQ